MPRTRARPAPTKTAPVYTRDASAGLDTLRRTEWLLTNSLGGYAMGTVPGIPTRRYHGLLIASLSPPVERVLALSSLVETVEVGGTRVELSTFRFRSGVDHPDGSRRLERFELGRECRWVYRAGDVQVVKTLRLVRGANAAVITYSINGTARLTLRPLVALRDHHHFVTANDAAQFASEPGEARVRVRRGDRLRVNLIADRGRFDADPQWWHGFEYRHELDRGFDGVEDLYSPGTFTVEFTPDSGPVAITATTDDKPPARPAPDAVPGVIARTLARAHGAKGDQRAALARLAAATDAYVVARHGATRTTTVIAGYPWFTDWGRDSLISLPGLLLATGRFDEARGVLETFARHRRRGLIPNLFQDGGGAAEYNTVDAPLWFLHAACEYARVSGDRDAMARGELRDACDEIIAAYITGTDNGIGVDPADGLVCAGDESTQLTWMDARRDGVVFTPRHGKAIEINALWHHGLMSVADLTEGGGAARLRERAAFAAASIRTLFWDKADNCCFDTLTPGRDGAYRPTRRIRPNQIFAVSLAYSALAPGQRKSVVRRVRDRLLTPCAVRTLDPSDGSYRGRFRGSMFERDGAYHNGTAWPWLLGPLAEAVMRVGAFSPASRTAARRMLAPLVARLDGESLGQLPEVFDGDHTPDQPQQPGGCIAQAWSVAETLRVLLLSHEHV